MSFIIPKPSIYEEVESTERFGIDEKSTVFSSDEVVLKVFQEHFRKMGVEIEAVEEQDEATIILMNEPEVKFVFEIEVNKSISIRSPDHISLLHGIQTFFQIALYHKNNIPHLKVLQTSQPFFRHRGLLFDCCRHFFSVPFVKTVLDLLSLYRFNIFHFHLTEDQAWRIEIKKYPLLTEKGTEQNSGKDRMYYTQDEIREIINYANERGIEVIPEIEMPGHCTSALVGYPEFSCLGTPQVLPTGKWGVFKDVFCIGNKKKLYPFLTSILDEVIDLFGHQTRRIHIGADEVPAVRWWDCAKCRKLMKEEGMERPRELQHYFIRWVSRYLKSKNFTMIGWDEILHDNVMKHINTNSREEEEEEEEGDAKSFLCVQVWRGHNYLEKALQLGIECIYSPTSHCYFDYHIEKLHLKQVYSINPFHNIPKDKWNLIRGVECNVWTERIETEEKWFQMVFPRILAISEKANNFEEEGGGDSYPEFVKRARNHYEVLKALKVSYGREGIGLV